MRTKMLSVLFLAFAAFSGGCGSPNPNNMHGGDGGTGGNGGTGGMGGGDGGGGGCTDQCTAGATRCADANDQETCMPMNGCLAWVKSACGANQVCKTGANDMGSGGACVTGVPCACPSGFTCDGNGVCQGGDPTKIPIDVKTVNVSGIVTLNGAAPTTNPSCDADMTAAKASVELTDTARGYLFKLPVPCSSSTFAWSGVVFPGTYTVRVVGENNYSSLPGQAFVSNPALTVGADTKDVALDVKTVSVGGSVTLNGAAPVSDATACGNDPSASVATVHFSDSTNGYQFDLDVPCSSATYSWGGSIFPGTYYVSVAGKDGYTTLPTSPFVFNKKLAVGGNLSNQVIAVATKNVAGNVTLNGVKPMATASCMGNDTFPQATVHLQDDNQGYAFDVNIPCSSTDYTWTAAVYPGNYAISVSGQSGYSNLPTSRFMGVMALPVNADVSGQTLAVKTNNVSGTITLNGTAPAPGTGCSGNGTYPQATVRLTDKAHGYSFTLEAPCSSATLAWSGVVFPGTYQVSVAGTGSYYTPIPMQAYVAQPALAVNADVTGDALDVKTVNVAGSITLNGTGPTVSTSCNNNPTAPMASVVLSDANDGYQFTINVPCSATTFTWSGSVYAGTYKARVLGVQGYSNVPTQAYLANGMLVANGNVTGQVLDVKTKSVGGSVTLNGAQPSTSTACNPSPTATKATIQFSDSDDGYSFSIPVACSSADFSYAGVVYPGVYSISVAGANGYSNLPTESFLGAPRLQIK